ncbi:necdin-like 2 [Cynoglossus semilaevis]|nr:non-structural maintenance of chromosomes element 3 homolog [Cynoglossus semilaevis]XP_024915289.1 non-structural maintenance of chromosomes element 3 homolog [Cynoglossus semilaevis]
MTQRKRATPSSQRQHGVSALQEDEDDIPFTQPSTSQVQKALENVTPAQLDHKASEVVQYFLVKQQKKIPVRRADLVKHVVKEYRNIFPEIMKSASKTLDQVFGLKLVEIDNKNHLYILISKLENVDGPHTSVSSPKVGLLFVILSVIFMKGGVVRENVIWNTLKKLRVDPGEKHAEFGDVKRLVTDEFVRQRYLECVRIPHTEPVEHEFHWGQRAELEVSKVKLLEFLGQLHDQDPQLWSQQFKEAHSSVNPPSS